MVSKYEVHHRSRWFQAMGTVDNLPTDDDDDALVSFNAEHKHLYFRIKEYENIAMILFLCIDTYTHIVVMSMYLNICRRCRGITVYPLNKFFL